MKGIKNIKKYKGENVREKKKNITPKWDSSSGLCFIYINTVYDTIGRAAASTTTMKASKDYTVTQRENMSLKNITTHFFNTISLSPMIVCA